MAPSCKDQLDVSKLFCLLINMVSENLKPTGCLFMRMSICSVCMSLVRLVHHNFRAPPPFSQVKIEEIHSVFFPRPQLAKLPAIFSHYSIHLVLNAKLRSCEDHFLKLCNTTRQGNEIQFY